MIIPVLYMENNDYQKQLDADSGFLFSSSASKVDLILVSEAGDGLIKVLSKTIEGSLTEQLVVSYLADTT